VLWHDKARPVENSARVRQQKRPPMRRRERGQKFNLARPFAGR